MQLVIILLFYRQGITMVVAYTLFNMLWLAAWQPFARRIIGLRWLDMLRDTVPFLLIAAAVMGATYGLTAHFSPLTAQLWVVLLVRVLVAAALYYALMRLLHVAILQECLQFLKNKRKS